MKVTIEKLNLDGYGVGHYNGKEILIPFALPGEEIFIKKLYKKKKKIIADEFDIIKESSAAIKPKCAFFGRCGGCMLQRLNYTHQIKFKESKLKKIFNRTIRVLPSPKVFAYRNKIDIVTSTDGIGFRKRGFWNKIIEVSNCPLFGEKASKSLQELRRMITQENISLYNLKEHKGLLRYMVLREGKFTGQLMVNLIFKREPPSEKLKDYFSFAHSVYFSINPGLSDVSFGKPIIYFKDEFIQEKILDIVYFIHPNTFFQNNSYQTEKMMLLIEKFVKGEKVIDLYSGIGTFSIFLAKKGYKVDAVELIPESVRMAKLNAMVNETFVNFKEGRAESLEHYDYDTVLVDPPRAGIPLKLVKKLNNSRAKRIVYISCNPYSLSENIGQLEKFRVKEMIGIDMFPQTPEVETIAVLDQK